MKRKLLSMAVALLCAAGAWAYTTSDLTSAGWTQVTSTDALTSAATAGNYFVLIDAGTSNYAVTHSLYLGNCAYYQATVNPCEDAGEMWTLESTSTENSFNLRNVSTKRYPSGWDCWMRETTTESWADCPTTFAVTLPDGKWTLTRTSDGKELGPYNDNKAVNVDGNTNPKVAGYENVAANKATGQPGFYIYTITPAAFWALSVADASKESPKNISYLIKNPSFETGGTDSWTVGSSSDTGVKESTGVYATLNLDGYRLFNTWSQGKPLTQNIGSLPGGKYQLSALIASSDATIDAHIYLMANGEKQEFTITQGTSGTFNRKSLDFEVTGTSDVTIGVVGGNNDGSYTAEGYWWYKADGFQLKFYGYNLYGAATELPEGGAMDANTWYYFDVETAGGYLMTATTLGDIVYTTDGTILTEDAASSVTATFSSPATLSATRYYVMSTSANTLTYTIDSYDLTNEIAAYNAAVTAATTAQTNADAADKVNAAEYTELTTAIANYTGENAIDTEGTQNSAMKTALETATSALTSATTAINTSIAAYANAKTYLDAVAPVLENTNVYTAAAYATNYSTPLDAYNAGTLSDADAAALTYGSHVTGNLPALLLSPWTATGTALYINTWSTEGNTDGSGMTTPFFQYWTEDGNTLAANTFTCTLEGLDASALYSIDVLARIKQRNGYAKVANAITLQVGSGTAVDMSTGTHIGTTRFFYDTYTAYGTTDANGTLTVTITVAANSNISWLAFKNMKYARANDATALAKAVAQVTALNGKVPTNIYDTANSVVTANSTPSEEAVSAIVAAANTAAAYVDAYADYLELKDYADALVAVSNNNSTANSTLSSAISTAASSVASVTSVSDVTTVTSTLKTAMITYAGAANPVGNSNKFDLTFMLTDANFDDCIAWENTTVNGVTGWATEQEDGNFQCLIFSNLNSFTVIIC